MARLRRIYIIHTTANESNADTDARFELIASSNGVDFIEEFPNLGHDERERGRTDEYTFNIPMDVNIDSGKTELIMRMISTTDGWLPSSMWAIGETDNGKKVLLGAHPKWPPRLYFDRGSNSDGADQQHRIDN